MKFSEKTANQVLPTYVAPLDPVYNANSRKNLPPTYSPQPKMTPSPQTRSGVTANEAQCCCFGLYCFLCCLDLGVGISST